MVCAVHVSVSASVRLCAHGNISVLAYLSVRSPCPSQRQAEEFQSRLSASPKDAEALEVGHLMGRSEGYSSTAWYSVLSNMTPAML